MYSITEYSDIRTEQIVNKVSSISNVEESLRELIKDVDSRMNCVESSKVR